MEVSFRFHLNEKWKESFSFFILNTAAIWRRRFFMFSERREVSNFSSFPPSLCRSERAMKVKMSCAQLSYCSENNCRSSLSHLRLAKQRRRNYFKCATTERVWRQQTTSNIAKFTHRKESFNFFIVRRVSAFFLLSFTSPCRLNMLCNRLAARTHMGREEKVPEEVSRFLESFINQLSFFPHSTLSSMWIARAAIGQTRNFFFCTTIVWYILKFILIFYHRSASTWRGDVHI